jgi:hypothetical protein
VLSSFIRASDPPSAPGDPDDEPEQATTHPIHAGARMETVSEGRIGDTKACYTPLMPRGRVALLLALIGAATPGCDRHATAGPRDSGGASAPSSAASSGVSCTRDPAFPVTFSVPEASAAAEVELTPGVRELLVVSDSGRRGAAILWRLPSGPSRPLALPLDPSASDDLEGIAWVTAQATGGGGALYTLTSSGAARRFVPDGQGGLRRDQDAYAIGPAPHSCANLRDVNCGRNYEGLCLRPRSVSARCAGYAASKQAAELDCLVFEGDRLVADTLWPPIHLGRGFVPANALSDCAFGASGGPARATLLVTTNVYGGSATYLVAEQGGALTPLDVPGTLNNEAVAVDRDGALALFGDVESEISPAVRLACRGW